MALESEGQRPAKLRADDLLGDKNGQTGSDSETISARPGSQLDDGNEKIGPEAVPEPEPAVDSADPTPPPPLQEYLHGAKLYVLLSAIIVPYFLMTLDQTILATVSGALAIPYITDEFHSLLDVGWYASAFQISNAALQPLTGKVYSRMNIKWTFLSFFLIFEIGSAVCGAAQSSIMLIIGRAIAGLGSSGLMNGALTILANAVPPQKQPGYIGLSLAIAQLGIVAGPLVGGALTEYASWRWCFYINLPLAVCVVPVFLLMHIPEQVAKPKWTTVLKRPFQEFDLVGFALFAPAAIMFFLALQYGGNQFAWGSATVIGLFVGAGATFGVWIGWDVYRGEDAMVPISVLRNRRVWASCSMWLFLCGTLFIPAYYLPIYFQTVLDATPLMSGVYILPIILPQMFFSILSSKAVERTGYYMPYIIFGGVVNCIGVGLTSTLDPDSSKGKWVGYEILMGVARGVSVPMAILAIQNAVPKKFIPVAMSIFVFCQTFGAAVMIVFAQTIFTNSLRNLIIDYAPSVDADFVINIGAHAVRGVLSPGDLVGVLWAYTGSLARIYYLAVGCAVASLAFAPFMGWVDVRKHEDTGDKKPVKAEKGGDEPSASVKAEV
ncbi:putative MFS multidrug transporter [Podospora didyma]|uniref:MFS multidrug transporter n=1 Tax=Podospora didyma TaxID=330526 RepID=A0AAE0NXH9_9PEZI|nr:putative MFS multidrug transporter [Podospora didyma]